MGLGRSEEIKPADKIVHIVPFRAGRLVHSHLDPKQQLRERLELYDEGLASIANYYRENPDRLLKFNYKELIRNKKHYDPQRVDRIQFAAGSDPGSPWLVEMDLRRLKGTK